MISDPLSEKTLTRLYLDEATSLLSEVDELRELAAGRYE